MLWVYSSTKFVIITGAFSGFIKSSRLISPEVILSMNTVIISSASSRNLSCRAFLISGNLLMSPVMSSDISAIYSRVLALNAFWSIFTPKALVSAASSTDTKSENSKSKSFPSSPNFVLENISSSGFASCFFTISVSLDFSIICVTSDGKYATPLPPLNISVFITATPVIFNFSALLYTWRI